MYEYHLMFYWSPNPIDQRWSMIHVPTCSAIRIGKQLSSEHQFVALPLQHSLERKQQYIYIYINKYIYIWSPPKDLPKSSWYLQYKMHFFPVPNFTTILKVKFWMHLIYSINCSLWSKIRWTYQMHQVTKEEIKFNKNEIIESTECISFISFSFHFSFLAKFKKIKKVKRPRRPKPRLFNFIKQNQINQIRQ